MERKRASDYPQELLNLFDKFVHGDIPRREFLDGAQKTLPVWRTHRRRHPRESHAQFRLAQQVPKDDKRIIVETVTVDSPKGNGTIRGHFARPAKSSGKLPTSW